MGRRLLLMQDQAKRLLWASALLASAILTCAQFPTAQAQKIAPASNGQITGVTQNVRAGTVARVPGGERVGGGGFATSEGTATVVHGKVAGYGARSTTSLGEYASQGPSAGFTSSFSRGDFPVSDFVGTMPGPVFSGGSSVSSGVPGSGFGVTLSAANTVGSRNAFSSASSHGLKNTPHTSMKDPEAILHPFTHTIGSGNGTGTLLGSSPGLGH